jgi:hypothetical protein
VDSLRRLRGAQIAPSPCGTREATCPPTVATAVNVSLRSAWNPRHTLTGAARSARQRPEVCFLIRPRGLTPRSRGDPPRLGAWPDRPEVSVGQSGQSPSRSGRLSSNVRRHEGAAVDARKREETADAAPPVRVAPAFVVGLLVPVLADAAAGVPVLLQYRQPVERAARMRARLPRQLKFRLQGPWLWGKLAPALRHWREHMLVSCTRGRALPPACP